MPRPCDPCLDASRHHRRRRLARDPGGRRRQGLPDLGQSRATADRPRPASQRIAAGGRAAARRRAPACVRAPAHPRPPGAARHQLRPAPRAHPWPHRRPAGAGFRLQPGADRAREHPHQRRDPGPHPRPHRCGHRRHHRLRRHRRLHRATGQDLQLRHGPAPGLFGAGARGAGHPDRGRTDARCGCGRQGRDPARGHRLVPAAPGQRRQHSRSAMRRSRPRR